MSVAKKEEKAWGHSDDPDGVSKLVVDWLQGAWRGSPQRQEQPIDQEMER